MFFFYFFIMKLRAILRQSYRKYDATFVNTMMLVCIAPYLKIQAKLTFRELSFHYFFIVLSISMTFRRLSILFLERPLLRSLIFTLLSREQQFRSRRIELDCICKISFEFLADAIELFEYGLRFTVLYYSLTHRNVGLKKKEKNLLHDYGRYTLFFIQISFPFFFCLFLQIDM